MRVYHGSILTVDEKDTVVQYLVEDSGRIVFTGNELPAKWSDAPRVELGDRALCPSFADTHAHFASFATFNAGLNVMDAESNTDIADALHDFAASSTSSLLLAFGASSHSVRERRLVSREELDRVCGRKPAVVIKYDGHACIVNSALLAKLRKRLEHLRGYHPESGEMNQEAFFAVSDYITNSISLPTLVRNMQHAMDLYASRGFGLVHSVSGVGFALNLDITLECLLANSAQNGFQLRIFPQSLNISTATRRHLPRIGGCFECALDGCFGSKDAALLSPYIDEAGNGVLYYDDEKVLKFVESANQAALQIEMHAIGDKAFDQAARCLKAALEKHPRSDHRHGIIHACLPTDDGLDICAQYGIHLPVQPAFIDWNQEPDAYLADILGPERAAKLNPLRSMSDRGIRLSAGSDAPCTDPDPIMWLSKACNHTNPAESLTIREALRMCTYNGYWASFDEKNRGSLEVGKIADMVILSKSPYATPANQLSEITVEQTFLSGEAYQPQNQNAARALLAGLS